MTSYVPALSARDAWCVLDDTARFYRADCALYNPCVPIGTAFHPRTFALCESLNYREWSGYYAVSTYETHHEHEYNAIRNAAALIDISPLFKYLVTGPDATRLDEQAYRWTAADPSLRWLRQNSAGLQVEIEDVSERIAALALQGPTAARVLRAASDIDVDSLRYFRVASGRIGSVQVDVSRTGYTGDLGYEIWMPVDAALEIWDTLMHEGRSHDIKPAGMLALDVARVEAGLLLIDVDFTGSRKALIASQTYSPFEMGLGRLVSTQKGPFVGRKPLLDEARRGPSRTIAGLEVDWSEVERLYDRFGLAPVAPSAASRVAVPVMRDGQQIGRATTTAWSPTLKRLIAIATLDAPFFAHGTRVEIELTVEARRYYVGATVVPTPFFNPGRKIETPPL
jgi:aminomethyltransferase